MTMTEMKANMKSPFWCSDEIGDWPESKATKILIDMCENVTKQGNMRINVKYV